MHKRRTINAEDVLKGHERGSEETQVMVEPTSGGFTLEDCIEQIEWCREKLAESQQIWNERHATLSVAGRHSISSHIRDMNKTITFYEQHRDNILRAKDNENR